ncbi:uncharacterized protein ASCRUDRAFT_9782 [Ascoidea rubescens DSM 1968]|uniref:Uncharacterized protein n=1 Tax=Ascoidea rubescens DSM 1968 TaxID=1344418 RepID=A0A1D2VBP3_9ASCO|nr:hypothetical protein ASCRUDRAFT_9782 [Ascoidea rubescens DSM 1968]ODV59030.1 hypothetical protein ASCRUDRAFT_9782 [Ascoidea rubescens DSM 1968]
MNNKKAQPQEPSRAFYNPYDPTDQRPVGGYPSEFAVPGRQSHLGPINTPDQYQTVRHIMKRLNYTPRPKSQLYPGQFKILRKINRNEKFNKGINIASNFLTYGVVIYAVFFQRWNDGYDNVFSDFYRFRLRCQLYLRGSLTKQQYEDLIPKKKPFNLQKIDSKPVEDIDNETEYHLQRPSKDQLIIAQKELQEREEKYLKALDIAEQIVSESKQNNSLPLNGNESEITKSDNDKRKKWFGIF